MSLSRVFTVNSSWEDGGVGLAGNLSIVLLGDGDDSEFDEDYSSMRSDLAPGPRYVLASVLLLVIVFTILGNSLTIVAVCTQRRLQTVGNMYITSLACADLIVSSFVMSVLWLSTVLYDEWFLSEWFCPLWMFVKYVSFTASLTNVALIAWDRYNTVAWPLKALRRRTKRRAAYYILAAWMFPIIFWAFIISLVYLLNGPSPKNSCHLVWGRQGALVIVTASIAIYVPIVAIITLFTAMMYYLQGHMAKMNERMRRSASVKEGGDEAGFETSIDTPSVMMRTEANGVRAGGVDGDDTKPPLESSSLLTSTAMSISALSLDALSSFSYYDDALMFRSLESIPKEAGSSGAGAAGGESVSNSKTVGTSTSPERYGLVRSIGVNTTNAPAPASSFSAHLPDVANVGQHQQGGACGSSNKYRSFTRDTYHRGIKRISCRRDVHRKRYLNVDHNIWLSNRRGSSLESDRSTSMESDDGPNKTSNIPPFVVTDNRRRGNISAQESTSSTKSDDKSVSSTAPTVPIVPAIPAPPPPAVEPIVKIKLGEIGRQQSVDVDNITKNIDNNLLRNRYRHKLASLRGQSGGSSESDMSQSSQKSSSYLKPSIKLDEADRSMSDESNESGDQGRFLQVRPCLKSAPATKEETTTTTTTTTDTKKKLSLTLPGKKPKRSVSEDSTESNRFLRVAKKLGEIGRTSSNESTDSRYLRVEPRSVRFAHLGHSLSVESADNISVISCASQATNASSRSGGGGDGADGRSKADQRACMTAQMKRERYASVMRKERQTTLKQSRLRQQMRAAKTLGLIAGFLLLCWLPFAVMWPWKVYCSSCLSVRVFDLAKWATSLNSAINPIIYCMCNPMFRRAFRKLLVCRWRKFGRRNT